MELADRRNRPASHRPRNPATPQGADDRATTMMQVARPLEPGSRPFDLRKIFMKFLPEIFIWVLARSSQGNWWLMDRRETLGAVLALFCGVACVGVALPSW